MHEIAASGKKLPICVIGKRYPGYSTSSVYRHCKTGVSNKETDKGKTNEGRRNSLTVRYERRLICKLYKLREREGSFTAPLLQLETGLSNCFIKTIQRALKSHIFSYLQARRKEFMAPSEVKCRVQFANHIKKIFDKDIWKKDICFYLEGKNFVYKFNPRDQARVPKTREWREKNEGVTPSCVTKGN